MLFDCWEEQWTRKLNYMFWSYEGILTERTEWRFHKNNHMENPVTRLCGKNFSVCDAGYSVTSDLRIISNAFSQVHVFSVGKEICFIIFNVFSPIFRSRRPGLRRAGSRVSGRLVAIMIFTWEGKEGISFDFSYIERNEKNKLFSNI